MHAEHIHMFSHTYTQAQLQDCFYTLYNGEISCVHEWFTMQERFTTNEVKRRRFMWLSSSQAKRTKTELKRFNAYAKSYLLDTLELNVKSRCTYNWSGTYVSIFFLIYRLQNMHITKLNHCYYLVYACRSLAYRHEAIAR